MATKPTPIPVLDIAPTGSTPNILLDPAHGLYRIHGRSFPENPSKFFAIVLDYLCKWADIIDAPMEIDIRMDYHNSVSGRYLLEILHVIDTKRSAAGLSTGVVWHWAEEDDLKQGELYADLLTIPFAFVDESDDEELP